MRKLFIFSFFILLIDSKPLILESKGIPVQKGTRLYFLTSGTEAELTGITIKAEKNQIDTNVFVYSVPEIDGSLKPLTMTADGDDTVYFTRPEGSTVPVTLYLDRLTENLNVFPVFEKSKIQFKSGKNIFFGVDKPNGKILTIQNLKIDPTNNGFMRAESGVPGDAVQTRFFNSEIYDDVTFYNQLDIPISDFSMDPVFSGVSYTVCFGQATKNLQTAGLIMSNDFPYIMGLNDITYNINRVGNKDVSLHMHTFFNSSVPYTTYITLEFGFGVEQESLFPSQANGKLDANGTMNSVEIRSIGAFAIQYYTNLPSINVPDSSISPGQFTTPSVITTTKSSFFVQTSISVVTVLVSLLIL